MGLQTSTQRLSAYLKGGRFAPNQHAELRARIRRLFAPAYPPLLAYAMPTLSPEVPPGWAQDLHTYYLNQQLQAFHATAQYWNARTKEAKLKLGAGTFQ